ncbi:MAG: type IV toxin-antitoxin system AbiEi family antitoxin [Candidatus Omnitrophota bacterium]
MEGQIVQNIFSDCSSIILRGMLGEPDRKWTTLDFAARGVSKGLASEVLARAESLGYVERVRKGPGSYSRLIRKEKLLKDWTSQYAFERNPQTFYYYPKRDFLEVCTRYLGDKKISYALTLFSASRLIGAYVKDDRHFLYLDLDRGQLLPFLKEMALQTGLLKLVQGGNVCFSVPFYRSSVFKDSKTAQGYPAVSDLQLYLDLMGFPPSGPEEAAHLLSSYIRKGESFV